LILSNIAHQSKALTCKYNMIRPLRYTLPLVAMEQTIFPASGR